MGDGDGVRRPLGGGQRRGGAFGFGVVLAALAAGLQGEDEIGGLLGQPFAGGLIAGREGEGPGLAALDGFEDGVEGAGGGGGGGDVACAVAVRAADIHADAPVGGGGVVGGEGLDAEHDLDFVSGVEGGEGLQGGEHAPVGPGAGFGGIAEGEGADEGADGFVDADRVDGAVEAEEGVWGWGGFGLDFWHAGKMFFLCSQIWLGDGGRGWRVQEAGVFFWVECGWRPIGTECGDDRSVGRGCLSDRVRRFRGVRSTFRYYAGRRG